MNMEKVAIIIVNYKNENLTIRFIKEQLVKIAFPYSVIIVNNTASDASDNKLSKTLNAPVVYDVNSYNYREEDSCFVIHENENCGFAKANNTGSIFARYHLNSDYLLFTNNDIEIIDKDVITQLIKCLKNNSEIGLIGPKVIGLDGRLQSPEPYYSFFDLMVRPYFSILKTKNTNNCSYSVNAKEGFHYKVMGSFFLLKTCDFFQCGMMDTNTFLYFEENILSERLRKIGKKVYYYPGVSVLHAHSQTISKYASFKRQRNFMFNSGAYYYKTYRSINGIYISFAWLLKEFSIFVGSIRRLFS